MDEIAARTAQSVSTNVTASSPAVILVGDSSPTSYMGVFFTILTSLPSILYWIVTFITITFPSWLFSFLSTSLTLTINMTTLLLILVFLVSSVSWLVRYRFMNMYSRLPPNPQRKEPLVEVFPEPQDGDSKPGLANYLDEFLSAIKVFGYLERPVFHELTRTMQTKKLIAGETLLLEEEKGFCLVVDGCVQIFVKSNQPRDDGSEYDSGSGNDGPLLGDEDKGKASHQGYQLLTEVKNGAPMSSLFSILALFTEDVKLRHDEPDEVPRGNHRSVFRQSGFATPASGGMSPPTMHASPSRPISRIGDLSLVLNDGQGLAHSSVTPLSLDGETDGYPYFHPDHIKEQKNTDQKTRRSKTASAHPDIVARASVDTTIAIIPATAFHRLTRVYPKATAHIVQVILTRLQRVTLATGHAYLGLTSEVLMTEKLMDMFTTYDLPDFLRGSVLERLKGKFRKVSSCLLFPFSGFSLTELGTRAYRTRREDKRYCPS